MKPFSIALAFLLLSTTVLFAQGTPLPVNPADAEPISFLSILLKGGKVIMIPLALLSFIAVLLIMFYFLTIRQGAVVSANFMNAADALIRERDYLGLIAVCNRQNESIARITYRTLNFATKNPTAKLEEVREVAAAEGSRQASILNGRISHLYDIGTIAPMVGLLGTVLGMIKAFNNIGVGAAQMELAPGVSQALITTASGLVIGIPSFIFYSFFRGRVTKLISEMEAATTHLMALLAAQYKRVASRPPGGEDYDGGGEFESIGVDFPIGGGRQDPQGL